MISLTARHLSIRRGGRTLLDNVSLRAEAGELLAVVGANGAGKSTLLTALAGLRKPDAGQVMLNDVPLSELTGTTLARIRAYLPQNPRCEWPLSVERLVALGLTPSLPLFGDLPATARARATAALADCDLLAHREQSVTTLSGGEFARAMLARAFIGNPDILIVDEPLTGLDPRHAIEIATRLRAFARAGKLVIASLHDLTLAARYATRILALREGRLICDGPSGQILNAEMIRAVFDTDGKILGEVDYPYVDYRGPT